jgi:hypothetical protein
VIWATLAWLMAASSRPSIDVAAEPAQLHQVKGEAVREPARHAHLYVRRLARHALTPRPRCPV